MALMRNVLPVATRMPHLVAGWFDNADDARLAACKVRGDTGLAAQRVRLLPPGDSAHRATPFPWQSADRLRRLGAGCIGLIAGVLLTLVLRHAGLALVVNHLPHALLGLGLGGLAASILIQQRHSPRISDDAVRQAVASACRSGHWSVFVQPHDEAQTWSAMQALALTHAIRVVRNG